MTLTLDQTTASPDISPSTTSAIRLTTSRSRSTTSTSIATCPPPTEEEKTTQDAQAGDVVIPVATLKTLKINGKITAGAMKLGGIRLSQLDATLSAKDGVARLDPVSATLYQGKFAGGFTADAHAAPPTINIKGKATDIGVGMFLKDLSPGKPPMINGKGSFNLELTGKGNSYKKNLRSADEQVGFSLNDGNVNGFDLGYTLCTAYNTIARLPKPKARTRRRRRSSRSPARPSSPTACRRRTTSSAR